MISSLKKVCNFLGHPKNNLGELMKKSSLLDSLNNIIKENIDPELSKHCHVTNFQKGSITISCDSAEWLTLMRFEIPQLIQKLRTIETLRNLANVRCKVLKPKQVNRKNTRPKATLSADSAKHLRAFAQNTTDEKLKAIFNRIANRSLNDKT